MGSGNVRHSRSRKVACLQHKKRVKGKHRIRYATTSFCSCRISFKFNLTLQPSSFGTSKTSTTRPPSSAQHSPSLSPISEAFHPSESHHMATMPVEQFPIEELGASTSVGPSQGFVQENTPSEIPALCQVLQGNSVEHPPLPNEHTSSIVALQGSNKKLQVSRCDQQRQSEQEAAEQQ